MGQLPAGAVLLVEDVARGRSARRARSAQSRLHHPDHALGRRHGRDRGRPAPPLSRPSQGPQKEDICYATTNRQEAVKAIARRCDALVVIGAPNSSNSMRLVEVAANYGCREVAPGAARRRHRLELARRRAGGSASPPAPRRPRLLVDELIAACRERFDVTVEEVRTTEESVVFKLPRALVA